MLCRLQYSARKRRAVMNEGAVVYVWQRGLRQESVNFTLVSKAGDQGYRRQGSLKEGTDIRDITNMTPLAVPGRPELDFNQSQELQTALANLVQKSLGPVSEGKGQIHHCIPKLISFSVLRLNPVIDRAIEFNEGGKIPKNHPSKGQSTGEGESLLHPVAFGGVTQCCRCYQNPLAGRRACSFVVRRSRGGIT
ncbi:hypothetical protein ACJ73_01593 [Blastomyces percursus]|uniref:Uncharacterized protein n=1 Tax=Blastomyces percursus TaxID=1658174 RepID=A0A1J9REK2_9EURO|nr:hypothetical protein ACJ73_01593 [Blastomyces percursus]